SIAGDLLAFPRAGYRQRGPVTTRGTTTSVAGPTPVVGPHARVRARGMGAGIAAWAKEAPRDVDPSGGEGLLARRKLAYVLARRKLAYDVRSRMWRTVAAYHCLPSCAVGTRSALRPSAIVPNVSPRVR